MIETMQEMVWLRSLLKDLNISFPSLMLVHYDYQAAIFIVSNYTFYDRRKHMEIYFHHI